MKTRFLIIIIVAIAISSAIFLSYYAISDSSTDVFISCTHKYEKVGDKCIQLKPEQYCKDWCDLEELSELGCTELALDHVFMATNLFDEDFGDFYYRNLVGLPNGLSEEEFETCADIIKEKRVEYEPKKLWKSTDDWNSLRLVRNSDDLYCNSVNEESSVQCYLLDEIVFGNGNKRTETGWKLYPGGAGWIALLQALNI
jgi:hypothetical protein